MTLRIEECEYPSGAVYGVFFIGRHEIGRADKKSDGWVPFRKRKTLSAEMAAKAMIDTMANKAKEDAAHAKKMLEGLRMYCGGRLPYNVEFSGTPAASSPEAPLERRVGPGAQEER